jgi:hypothetical protein
MTHRDPLTELQSATHRLHSTRQRRFKLLLQPLAAQRGIMHVGGLGAHLLLMQTSCIGLYNISLPFLARQL